MGWNIARVQSYIVRGSFYAALPKMHRNFDTKRIKVAVLLLFNRSIQRGTPGSSATICQREQHHRQAKMIWICSQSL